MSNFITSQQFPSGIQCGYTFVIKKCPICCSNSPQMKVINYDFDKNTLVSKCSVCDNTFIIKPEILPETGYKQNLQIKIETIPNSKSEYYKHLQYCPDEIKTDFEEMLKTYDIGCYKSCVVMARRTMQSVARDTLSQNNLTATKPNGKSSEDLRDELVKLKTEGIILKKTFEMYTKTRKIANFGAHPNEDINEQITQMDAEQCIQCIILFIQEIYEQAELYDKISNNSKLA